MAKLQARQVEVARQETVVHEARKALHEDIVAAKAELGPQHDRLKNMAAAMEQEHLSMATELEMVRDELERERSRPKADESKSEVSKEAAAQRAELSQACFVRYPSDSHLTAII